MVKIPSPEKSLVASYIIGLMNRGNSARVDRLLKEDYAEIKTDPAIIDAILRVYLLSFFSETGGLDASKKLIEYFKSFQLSSAVLDAKNSMIICSKEGLDSPEEVLSPKLMSIVEKLIERDKATPIRMHVKSVVASCVLVGVLGSKFSSLMTSDVSDSVVLKFIQDSARECASDLKTRISESKPLEDRDDS